VQVSWKKLKNKNNPFIKSLSRVLPESLKSVGKIFPRFSLVFTVILGLCAAGCEKTMSLDSDRGITSSGGGVTGGGVTGSWRLTGADGHTWYIHFDNSGNWKITDDSAGTAQRVYGTYSFKNSKAQGPMKNPGVGTGEIIAAVAGNSMQLDFIEHWHTPHKVVKYSGTRL
jgi:hypothetical protein